MDGRIIVGLRGLMARDRHQEKGGLAAPSPVPHHGLGGYWVALLKTSWVQAPSGALVMTGADLPESRICTVRS